MPSGRTHDRLTVLTAAASLPAWLLIAPKHDPLPYACGVGAYLFSGFWLSDDLDTKSVCLKRWGLLQFLWWPYRLLVPHRSWLSHGVIVGPLLRLAYFAVAVWAVAKLAAAAVNRYFLVVDRTGILRHTRISIASWVLHHPPLVAAALIGLILGGFTHSVADSIASIWKRVW